MKLWKLVIVVLAVGVLSVSAVAQDDCATAVAAPGPVDPCTDTTPDGPLGSCATGGGVQNNWLTFVATATTAHMTTDLNSTGTDSDFIVYSGTCGDLTEIACSEDEGANLSPWLGDISVKDLNIGETYTVQLGAWGDYCSGPYVLDVIMPDDSGRMCGDNIVNVAGEICDGTDNSACAGGECEADCRGCLAPSPALPPLGLIGLGLLLVGGGATAVARRRKKA